VTSVSAVEEQLYGQRSEVVEGQYFIVRVNFA